MPVLRTQRATYHQAEKHLTKLRAEVIGGMWK